MKIKQSPEELRANIALLSNAAIGETVTPKNLERVKIRASYFGGGCNDCQYQHLGGARACPLKNACMAHQRPDRESVVFVNPRIQ